MAVPNFMLALAIVAETDLVAALPKRFVKMHAHRYAVTWSNPPVPLPSAPIRAVVPRVATMDAGLEWFLETIERTARIEPTGRQRIFRRSKA